MSVRLRERGGGSGRVSAAQPGKQPSESAKELLCKSSLVSKGGMSVSTSHLHGATGHAGKENRSQRNVSVPRQRPSVSEHSSALRRSTSSIPVSDKVAVLPSISRRRSVQAAALEGSKRKESGARSARCRDDKKYGDCQVRIAVRVPVDPVPSGILTTEQVRKALSQENVVETKDEKPDVGCGLAHTDLVVHSDQKVPFSSSFSSSSSSISSAPAFLSSSSTSSSTSTTVPSTTSTSNPSSPSSSAINTSPEAPNGVGSDFSVADSAAGERQIEATSASDTTESEIAVANNQVLERIGAIENSNGCGANDPKVGCRSYPSRVHEKLTLLEGRVRRIASDIERTKEMLDKNDDEATRKMLSDIQERISGIERDANRAAGGATGEGEMVQCGPQARDCALRQTELEDDQGTGVIVKPQSQTTGVSKAPLNIMNHEELEARFFPHHRLLKDRRVFERFSEQAIAPSEANKDVIGNLLNDEQLITSEFLASLEESPRHPSGSVTRNQILTHGWQEIGSESSTSGCGSDILHPGRSSGDTVLMSDEIFDDLDDQENRPLLSSKESDEEPDPDLLFDVGYKTSTGGWFVSEGEAVLLAHGDGSCSYYDVINLEEKSEYKPPDSIHPDIWGDCWLIRAPGVDGSAGKYVVAASAGSCLASGFCSWDFYSKSIKASRFDQGSCGSAEARASSSTVRSVLAPLDLTGTRRRVSTTTRSPTEAERWWYRPCGCLLLAASNTQSVVSAYDIRDGALVMAWGVGDPLASMECSSPLQWRSRGKVVTVGADNLVALWDVGSLNPRPLLSFGGASDGGSSKVEALHVNNTEADVGGGVRQRVSSSVIEGNDGAFCTRDTVSVLDFRLPSGVGLKIANFNSTATHSIFSQGNSIFVGSTAKAYSAPTAAASAASSVLQQFSLRMGKLQSAYPLPDGGVHANHSALVQVWGGSGLLMGVCGMGMFVFDGEEGAHRIGPEDLYCPSFDYLGGRLLVISKDRPAMWKYLR